MRVIRPFPQPGVHHESSCAFDGTAQQFNCPVVTIGNMRLARSFSLRSRVGPQSAFDAATTAAITSTTQLNRVDPYVVGVITTDAVESLRLDRFGDNTNTLLLTGGSVSHQIFVPTDATQRTVTSTATRMMRDIKLSPSVRWPIGGAIDIEMLTQGVSIVPGSVHMQIVFDGSSTARLTTTSNGPTRTCVVDLTGKTQDVCTQ